MVLKLASSSITRGNILYWYCDIIDFIKEFDKITFIDLLADIKVYENGNIEVLDLDELEEAYNKELITSKMYLDSLNKLNHLLRLIKEKKNMEDLIDYLIKVSE